MGIVNASEAFMLALLSISIPFNPHQPSQNRTIPRHAPHLASLVKGEVLSPEKIRATTGWIVPPSLATINPFQNRTIPRKLPTHLPYERSVCFASCKTSGVQLRASMPLYERSVGFASLRNSGRSTSGVHARPLSKVRCCRPKKFGRLPKGLPPVAPNTAIPTTLLKAHHAFRHTNPFQNRTITIAFRRGVSLLLPLHRILPFPQSSQKYNHPSLRTTFLAPLPKGAGLRQGYFLS